VDEAEPSLNVRDEMFGAADSANTRSQLR